MRRNTQEVRMELERRRDQYQERKNRRRKQLIAISGGLCCVAVVVAMLFPVQVPRRTLGGYDSTEYGYGYWGKTQPEAAPGASHFNGYWGKPQPEATPAIGHAGQNPSDVNPGSNPMGPDQIQELQEAVQESAHYQHGQYEYYLLNIETGIRALRIVENKSETLITDPVKVRAFLNLLYDTIAEDISNTRNCVWERGWKNYQALNGETKNPYIPDEQNCDIAEKLEVRVLFGNEERPLYWTMDEARKQVLREQLQK